MKNRCLLLTLLCLLLLMVFDLNAEEIVDLGSYGFVCEEKINIIKQGHSNYINTHSKLINFDKSVDLSFIHEPVKELSSREKMVSFKTGGKGINKKIKIFVFSATDQLSIEKAKNITADYGLCIKYSSINDIGSFREKTGVVFPIQLGNKDIVEYLKISEYPAIVTINNGEITVETIN